MASTVFTDHTTLILAAWLNDVNNWAYSGTFQGTQIKAPNGSVAAPAYTFASALSSGMLVSGTTLQFSSNNTLSLAVAQNGNVSIPLDTAVLSMGVGETVRLYWDGAAALGQRNSTAPQGFNLYNTWTSAANFERLQFAWAANEVTIATAAAGAGINRPMNIGTLGSAPVRFLISGTTRWFIDTDFFLKANPDNTLDIGTSSTFRPRNIYVGTNIVAGDSTLQISLASASGSIHFQNSPGNANIDMGMLGGASDPSLYFYNRANSGMTFGTNNISRWQITNSGHLLATTDNTLDIGVAGATRPRTGYFATSVLSTDFQQLSSGSNMLISTQGARDLNIRTNGNLTQFTVAHSASVVNYLQVTGGTTGNGAIMTSAGTDTDINCHLSAKGAGSVLLQSGAGVRTIAQFADITSSVNYVLIQGSATGNPLEISAVGTDTNIPWVYDSKGTGAHTFRSHDGGNNQFQVLSTVSASRYITVTGSNGGNPTISTSAGNIAFGAPAVFLNTGLTVLDTDASHVLSIVPGSNLTANRQFTLTTGDAARTLTLNGNPTLDDWFDQSVKAAATPTFAALTLSGLTANLTVGGASMVQNSQSTAYTTVASDANKHLLHPTADNNARTFTIAANASVAYAIGTAITFVNQINTMTIAINSDTLVLQGPGTTGSRTLAANGIATALKVAATVWVISGTGLT